MVTTLLKNRYGEQTAHSISVSLQNILMSGVNFKKEVLCFANIIFGLRTRKIRLSRNNIAGITG
jgi:hypothetical protein